MRYWRNIDPLAQVAYCTQRGNSLALFHRRVSGTRSNCKSYSRIKLIMTFQLQVLMNTILFWRILSVDFSGMFRSASFSPRDANNTKLEKSAGEGLGNYLKNVLQEEDKSDNVKLAQE